MDTDHQSSQFTFGRDSPCMFANTFSDSEDEIENEVDCAVGYIPIARNDDSKNEKGNLETTQTECEPGDEPEDKIEGEGQNVNHLPLQDESENDSCAEKQDIQTMPSSHSQPEKQHMTDDDSMNHFKTLEDASKTQTGLTESLAMTYRDNLKHGWELYEDDIWCMPVLHNTTNQSVPVKKTQSGNGWKSKSKRMMMNKFKKGAYRYVVMSPMTMIARHVKRNGYDLATFMETSEFMGGPSLQMPCMQCYEQFGGKSGTGADSMLDSMFQEGGSSSGKCSRCGGQVQTLASFGKMIRQMRDKIEDKGLIPHDVYPDGNCLFAAIVDQLRVRGDFTFTSQSLRQAAVNHLKENPTSDDGTPLEMFLTDGETWNMYLARMGEDGEWGDHMILTALANVINKKIVIYGGTSGQSETILYPASYDETDTDDRDAFDGQTTYLGHVSESHYISLRPKCWRQKLRNGVKERITLAESSPEGKMQALCPVNQLNFILRQAYRMDCIQTYGSDSIDSMYPTFEEHGCKMDMYGPAVCKLVPCKINSGSYGPDVSMFFPSAKEEEDIYTCFQKHVFNAFMIPDDTNIVETMSSAKSVDLIAENDAKVPGNLKLVPKIPKKWQGQTVVCEESAREITCLKGFNLNFGMPDETIFKMFSSESPFEFRLAFKCAWPTLANDWLTRKRESGFPDEYTLKRVFNGGCHVIPLTPDTSMSNIIDDPVNFLTSVDDHTWCYTFAAAEKEICRFLLAEQRKTFLVFKALVDVTLKDIPMPPSVFKSIFFYACENIEKQRWKSKPGECLFILIKKCIEGLKSHHIQHYFLVEKNLLDHVPAEAIDESCDRLECSRRMPIVTLYFLLDQLNIMSSEIGAFVEEIIETVKMDSKVSTIGSITSQSLLQVCSDLMLNMIYQDDFKSAWLVFQDIMDEERCHLTTEYIDLIKRLLPDVDVGYIWCFALYIDLQQKSNFTKTVCDGYNCVHITEVFGSECIEELPDTLVHECFSISNGDLHFFEKVSSIMSETISGQLYIKCMKFYLKKYAEVAGEALIISYPASGVSASKTTTSQLQDIYVRLFNYCYANDVVEEFRDMMPFYTKLVEKLDTQHSVRNLVTILRYLGENKKAEDVRRKMGAEMGGQVLQSLVSSIFNDYELD